MAPERFACPEGDRLRWTDRLDIVCLGRCSCTNQVSSVSLSVLCRQRMNISPVTHKKERKKNKNPPATEGGLMGPPRVSVPLTSPIRLTPLQSSCGKLAGPQLLMARYPKLSKPN